MNKKITPKVIKIIVLQAVVVAIAVSVFGGAVITHQKYKSIAASSDVTGSAVTQQNASGTNSVSQNSESSSSVPASAPSTASSAPTQPSEEPSTQPPEEEPSASEQYPYAYAGFTPQITDVNADLSRFIVNGNYSLPVEYKPQLAEAVKGSGVYLDHRVAPYYQQMYDAAQADGITLTPISGYRSYERQKNNFENRIEENMAAGMDKTEATKTAATVIMVPGSSEHNAGLAMDICSLSQSFENNPAFDWLDEHAAEYGFILRYPKDEASREITGVIYEPWHYRFVGVETAKEIKAKGITFEEYLGLA